MKLKTLSLIAGAIALSLTATPFAVKAETTSSSPLVVAQVRQKGQYQNLGLTDAQKAQMAEINRNAREQMNNILTPEQREQLKTAMQNRQGKRNAFDSLNLTDDQKTQLRAIRESKKTQMEAVLTDEQKQQLQKFREERRERRQQPNS